MTTFDVSNRQLASLLWMLTLLARLNILHETRVPGIRKSIAKCERMKLVVA